jgi:hypothetical protein
MLLGHLRTLNLKDVDLCNIYLGFGFHLVMCSGSCVRGGCLLCTGKCARGPAHRHRKTSAQPQREGALTAEVQAGGLAYPLGSPNPLRSAPSRTKIILPGGAINKRPEEENRQLAEQ